MEPSDEIKFFLHTDVLHRFLRYVQVHTTSDPYSDSSPSSARQLDLLRMLEEELRELGIADVFFDLRGGLYAKLPASPGIHGTPFTLLAHVDTSPEQSGDGVKPRVVIYEGAPIGYPDDPALTLSEKDSPQLASLIGQNIVVASGLTLLGADDKAGVAEIMTALAAFRKFPKLIHPEICICFSTDEEIGQSVSRIDTARLSRNCYTMDGSEPGELEVECFDARKAVIDFHGVCVHPGAFGKGRLVNALKAAARFVTLLPDKESPEHTEGREGFYYVDSIAGSCEKASVEVILRDFEASKNEERIALLHRVLHDVQEHTPGLRTEMSLTYQYHNMRECLETHPEVVAVAEDAIRDAGLTVLRKAIRGGTDGSHLCQMGHPTPNIFAGGMLFHSRKEWIAVKSLAKAAEVILHLGSRWAER